MECSELIAMLKVNNKRQATSDKRFAKEQRKNNVKWGREI